MGVTSVSGLLIVFLIPILFLIHSLRNKLVKKEVTTLYIWDQIIKEQSGNIRIKSILKNIALILQILIVTLVALTLANPFFYQKKSLPSKTILVMDTSASMKTLTGRGTRFDIASEIAFEFLDRLTDANQLMVIDAGNEPKIVAGFSNDKTLLKHAVSLISPKDVAGNMEKAIYLALSFFSFNTENQIQVITDGAGYDLESLIKLNKNIIPSIIRGGAKNIGITQFEFRHQPGKKNRFEIMVEIANFSNSPVICPLSIKTGNNTIISKRIGLDAFEKKISIFPFSGSIDRIVTAQIQIKDDLPLDNTAFAILTPPPPKRVFLVSKGNYFLEKFLSVCPNLQVNSTNKMIKSSWDEIVARNDIVILDNVEPPVTSTGNLLLINTLSPDIPIKQIGQVAHPQITDWDKSSPITAGISFSGLNIENGMKTESGPGVVHILESKETSLISLFHDSKIKAVFVGFDFLQSDLPLRVAFPVLMNNIFKWFIPVENRFLSTSIKSGRPIEVNLRTGAYPLSIRRPSNTWEKKDFGKGVFTYTATDEVGIYKVKENRTSHLFAVNLVDEKESDIIGPDLKLFQNQPTTDLKNEDFDIQAKPLWTLFLVAAFIIGIVETFLWLKKE